MRIMDNSNKKQFLGSLHLALTGNEKDDWYIAFSRDGNRCIEGTWEDWVDFAKAILNMDRLR